MAIDLGDPARWRDSLPARQPASSEVAAGAVSGVVGGLVAWGAAMALAGEALGGLFPLRLVAATLYGPSAVAPDNVGLPVFVGALLVAFAAVTYGLVSSGPRRRFAGHWASEWCTERCSTSPPGSSSCTSSTRCSTRQARGTGR
jgi:hypothetical protein